MLLIDILGFIGSILVGVAFIPQTYSTLITPDSARSISYAFLTIIILSSILLLVYSSYYKILPMLITNVSVLLNSLVLTYTKIRNSLKETHDCLNRL